MRRPPEHLRIATVDQVMALPSVTYADKSRLPNAPGVYFVLSDDGAILYVGAAWESLKRRWLDHAQTRMTRRLHGVWIAYLICAEDGLRHEAEAFAIYHLQPILNRAYKKRKPYAD